MNQIIDFLLSIGFGKNEAEIYCVLIQLGKSSVLEISKKTNIHRSNIYDSLRKLIKEGLVYEITSERKLFMARHPECLLDFLKNKEIEVKNILKELREKTLNQQLHEDVKLSKGLFSLKEALLGLLELNNPIKVYGIPGDAAERIGPLIEEFHKTRIKKQIPMYHIFNSDGIKRVEYLNTLPHTEAKILSKNMILMQQQIYVEQK